MSYDGPNYKAIMIIFFRAIICKFKPAVFMVILTRSTKKNLKNVSALTLGFQTRVKTEV